MNHSRLLVCVVAIVIVPAIALLAVPTARAYGNTAIWQIGLSFNCNNPDFCVDEDGNPMQGGFWGWVEFDSGGLGDATLVGCSHLVAGGPSFVSGAQFFSVKITGWTTAAGSAGPSTFFITDGTMTFKGGSVGGPPVTVPISPLPLDTGIPAVAGHYNTAMILGFTPPPGVAIVIQVVEIPNS